MRKTWIAIALAAGSVLALSTCENPTKTFFSGIYTVSFDLNYPGAGTPPPAEKVKRGDPLILPMPNESPSGQTFSEWRTEPSGGIRAGGAFSTYIPDRSITLYAAWTTNTYPLTYNGSGGALSGGTPEGDYAEGTTVTLPGSGTKTGYTLSGFTLSGAASGAYLPGETFPMPAGAVTATATWTVNLYLLAYDPAGGTLSGGTPEGDIPYNTAVALPPSGVKEEYNLGGFTLSGALTGTKNPGEIFLMPAGDTGATAIWTALPVYTVTFDLNMQEATGQPPRQTVMEGGRVNEPAAPVSPGYTFGGWHKDPACVTPWDFIADTVTENITLWAKWTVNTFDLSTNTGTGGGWTYANNELRVRNGAELRLIGHTATTHVVIEAGAAASVTIYEVMIDFLREDWPTTTIWSVSPLKLEKGANLTLLLSGVNIFTAAGHAAALNAPEGTTLTITSAAGDGSEEGRLLAQVGDDTWMGRSNHGRGSEGAGIGGNDGENGGKITLKGGFVTGRCFGHGAGIGGGQNGHAGTILITGGAVEGLCDWWQFWHMKQSGYFQIDGFGGAGIGAGGTTGRNEKSLKGDFKKSLERPAYREPAVQYYWPAGSIVITGGRVHAWGGEDAAGIGGSASWVLPARIQITEPARVTVGSGVCFWGGDIYVIGSGHWDCGGSLEPGAGTVNVYGLPLSELRMDNGDIWPPASNLSGTMHYPTHKSAGGYMEKAFNGGY